MPISAISPSTILRKFQELKIFIRNVLSQVSNHRIELNLYDGDGYAQINPNIIMSTFEVLPEDTVPFPIISFDLLCSWTKNKDMIMNYRRLLAARIVLNTCWLIVNINNLPPTLIDECKRWLYRAPKGVGAGKFEGLLEGGNLRVLHLVDNAGLQLIGNGIIGSTFIGDGINHSFWRLLNLLSEVWKILLLWKI